MAFIYVAFGYMFLLLFFLCRRSEVGIGLITFSVFGFPTLLGAVIGCLVLVEHYG
jgi:hypothetical protein